MNIVEQLHRLRVRLNRDPRIAIVKQMSRSLPVFPLKYLAYAVSAHCIAFEKVVKWVINHQMEVVVHKAPR